MTSKNYRKHVRVDSSNLSHVVVDDGKSIVNQGIGRTVNISESGILLETAFATLPGHNLSITIAIEENLLDISGKVVRCDKTGPNLFHTGVKFQKIDEETHDLLINYIKMFEKIQYT